MSGNYSFQFVSSVISGMYWNTSRALLGMGNSLLCTYWCSLKISHLI